MATSQAYLEKGDYPQNWKEIARAVKERAGWQCEWIEHGRRCERRQGDPIPGNTKGWKVVLSVMHLNHRPDDCSMDNLRASCSLHHLRYDAPMHAKHARQTRNRKALESARDAGQIAWMEE